MRLNGKLKQVATSLLLTVMIGNLAIAGVGAAPNVEASSSNAQIVVDYNTSIGTGSKYLFGGSGMPSASEADAWSALSGEMGLRLIKMPVDLARMFPTNSGEPATDVMEEYFHVATGYLTRAKGSNLDVMVEFINLPAWLDINGDHKYDDAMKYETMVQRFFQEVRGSYQDTVKFIEIAPDPTLTDADFADVYYTTARAVRAENRQIQIGGPGYTLTSKSDSSLGKVRHVLEQYQTVNDKSLLQFVSLRAYGVNATSDAQDYFGEFKAGRKNIRTWSGNADLPLFMTGWTTVGKSATTPDSSIYGDAGIQQQSIALFKAMRDGWSGVLFNSTQSKANSPASYAYDMTDGTVKLNPYAKAWNLLSKKLKLGVGDFKVVSTNMGSNWAVDDSIAMINSQNEAIILATNFSTARTNVTIEMKNVPYEDGAVTLKGYVASGISNVDQAFVSIPAQVLNGVISATIPSIPASSMIGIVVTEGTTKSLPVQSLYEFESQDNHFGGNMEIGWTSGASFNRTVSGFGGVNNFVKLQKIAVAGSGTYKARLYAASKNSNIQVNVNDGTPISVDGSAVSLSNYVEFDVRLEAGNQNTMKFWTTSGELKSDKLVLIAQSIDGMSIGFQNLISLDSVDSDATKKYILPLARTDFRIDGRVFPENSAITTLEYTSSNPNVVTVDNNGNLNPRSEGESTITANVTGHPEVSNSFKLIVKNAVSGIIVSPASLTLMQNQTATITATIIPGNVANKDIRWASSDPSKVEIVSSDNNQATVHAIASSGTVNISATTEDGNYVKNSVVTIMIPDAGGKVSLDFGSNIAMGSEKIFGVTHYPSLNSNDSDIGNHSEVWPMFRDDVGVKFMRADARLQEILPIWTKRPNTNWAGNPSAPAGRPTYVMSDDYYVTGPDGIKRQFTVADYKADMDYFKAHGTYLNGMSNLDNWNTDRLVNWVKKADEMGFEVMVMTFQMPEWLAAGQRGAGDPHTVNLCNSAPKDWEIYRDIIKKIYKMIRPHIDYYEFLNEPHGYIASGGNQIRPDGTPYPNLETGKKRELIGSDILYQGIDAIYEAEREITGDPNAKPPIKMGGGADDQWGGTFGVLGTMFSTNYGFEAWHDRIDFVSIHKYGDRPVNSNNTNESTSNSRSLKQWLRQTTDRDIPIFLNEYNYNTGNAGDFHNGAKSLSYHGQIMIDMMVEGYEGGGYYTAYPMDVPMDDYEASSGWVERGKGMYAWNNGAPFLAQFIKTWDLLSNKLQLGDGKFTVHSASVAQGSLSNAVGATNIHGAPVAFINNLKANKYGNITVEMNQVPFAVGSNVTAKIYSLSDSTQFNSPPVVKNVTVDEDGSISVIVDFIDSYGVAGIILEGILEHKDQTTYEFESYLNVFDGSVKINTEDRASNGRWLTNMGGGINNSVTVPMTFTNAGDITLNLAYQSNTATTLYITVGGAGLEIALEATNGAIRTKELVLNVQPGVNQVQFSSNESLILDKLSVVSFVDDEIVSIKPVTVMTTVGVAPVLPSVVTVVYSNGREMNIDIVWESVLEEQYAVEGNFSVQGTAAETSIPAIANVFVSKSGLPESVITLIQPVTVTTEVGVAPVLPSVVTAVYGDGRELPVDVVWATLSEEQYSEEGTFDVYGTVADTVITAIAKVIVLKGHIIEPSIEWINPVTVTTKEGIAPVLPSVVTAVYGDGREILVAVTWESITPDQYAHAGTFTVNGAIAEANVITVATVIVENVSNPDTSVPNPPASGGGTTSAPETRKEEPKQEPLYEDDNKEKSNQRVSYKLPSIPKEIPVPSFGDIVTNSWYYEAVAVIQGLGIMNGYDDGNFRPQGTITRAEFASVLVKAFGFEATDVQLNIADAKQIPAWAKTSIVSLMEKGIMKGYEDGTFRSNQGISRAEMIMMIVRALELPLSEVDSTMFADDGQIPVWAKPAVTAAVKAGIIRGDDFNKFAANKTATRGEVSVIIVNILKLFAHGD